MKVFVLVDDSSSWIVPFVNILVAKLKSDGHKIRLVFHQDDILRCDIAFYLGCTSIVRREIMDRSESRVVVHPSALPEGRGFSPLAWQVIQGKSLIIVTLFEATENIDEGDIYLTSEIQLNGTELNSEIKEKQGNIIVELCLKYIDSYGSCKSYKQTGLTSYYKRRTPNDSQLDPYKTIADQFDLLRVVDNKKYPAFFRYRGCDYVLEIKKK
jgi:methionyl-tRNA formyltransferase